MDYIKKSFFAKDNKISNYQDLTHSMQKINLLFEFQWVGICIFCLVTIKK